MAEIGELVADRYLVQSRIGRGGMSTVYLVVDQNLNAARALKELSAFHAADEAWRQRFLDEARQTARLVHPNIVTIHDHFEWQETPYIVMEYFALGDVKRLVNRLTHVQVVALLAAVLEGLDVAERAGIVHRDLKPDNVMRTDTRTVKIADFGIAKTLAEEAGLTPADFVPGTEIYTAPELLQGEKPTSASDLYSVGVVAYELLRGFPPFAADGAAPGEIANRKIREDSVPVQVVVPDLHIELATWVDRLLIRDPSRRYQTAADARAALETKADKAFGVSWSKDGGLPEDVPGTIRAVRRVPESGFRGHGELSRIVTAWRLGLRAATRAATLLATLWVIAAAFFWKEQWLYVVAALAFACLFALTYFDQREAYLARGIGRRSWRRSRREAAGQSG